MIIAEIGWNFLGDMSLAKKMIDDAKDAKCKYIKFQLCDPKYLKPGEWDNDGRREIYNKAYLDEQKYEELYNYCLSKDLVCFASIFNESGFDILSKFSREHIKIPSLEAYDMNIIKKSLDNFENVLLSTGALQYDELKKIEDFKNCENLTVLHCVSSYPLEYENSNFSKFFYLKDRFKKVGYSGHCKGVDDAIFAISNGAVAVEKHFTSDNDLPGRDNKFAILKDELKQICEFQNNVVKMMKDHGLDLQKSEIDAFKNYRGRWKN